MVRQGSSAIVQVIGADQHAFSLADHEGVHRDGSVSAVCDGDGMSSDAQTSHFTQHLLRLTGARSGEIDGVTDYIIDADLDASSPGSFGA
jgi:hypothetical protein